MKPTVVDIKKAIRSEQFRSQSSLDGIRYDLTDSRLEILGHQFAQPQTEFDLSENLNVLEFVECEFQDLRMTRLFVNFPIRIRFSKCKFNSLELSGNSNISVEFINHQQAENIKLSGFLASVEIQGDGSEKDSNGIKSVILDNIDWQSDSETRFHLYNEKLHHLRMGNVKVSCEISKGEIQILLLKSRTDGKLIIDRKSLIHQFRVISHSAEIYVTSASIKKTYFQGVGRNEGRFDVRDSQLGQLNIVQNAELNELKFRDCVIHEVKCIWGSVSLLSIIRSRIGELDLDLSEFLVDKIFITGKRRDDSHINNLIFRNGVLSRGYSGQISTIQLDDFSITRLNFESFNNQGNIFVSGLRGAPYEDISPFGEDTSQIISQKRLLQLNIISTDLGKINFISCDFSSHHLTFQASKIVEIFLSGTDFPTQIHADAKSAQAYYAQLKRVFENRGDTVTSMEYQRRELNAHLGSLSADLKSPGRTWTKIREWLTLGLNWASNDFGTSWSRALLVTIVLIGGIFVMHNRAIGYKAGTWTSLPERLNFIEILSLFPEFLFPIHKADYIPEAVGLKVNSESRLWDFIGKVIGGYLLYQFVQAFRKYGKR